ncbi:MAG: type II secretion system protein [Planctomycetota bacterium]
MKPIAKQSNKEAAFTIVELLTVMSIIIILMGLLAPAMNRVRRHAKWVAQKNQFHSIDVALEMFRTEFDGYPDSGATDSATPPQPYCGALKLSEAMLGQDLLGFHPDSRFRSDGIDGVPPPLGPNPLYVPATEIARKENVYLKLEQANAYELNNIYPNIATTTPTFNGDRFVLCDVYTRVMNMTTGKRIGMPILYYKAHTSLVAHDRINLANTQNIYKYQDNHDLVKVGKPWNPPPTGPDHTLYSDPLQFYRSTWNEKITTISKPYRSDSYILISAGFDGEYGTPDDVFNFED